MRFELPTPPVSDAASVALSPDGQRAAFEGTADGRSQLWLHSFAASTARPLPGTEAASFPFWSPDSRSIGFFADGKLKRIDVDTGSVRALANAPIGRGGTWNGDGTIVFSPGTNDALLRVAALGGESAPLTRLAPGQAGHRFPQFLPDGRHVLYYVTGSPESRGVVLADLDGAETRRLLDADTAAVFASSGHLFFARQGVFHLQRFDPVTRELGGAAIALPDKVAVDSTVYRVAFSASAVGSAVYRVASSAGERQFTWFDRAGLAIGAAGGRMDGILSPSMSADGRSVAFSRSVNGNQDIWLLDVPSGDVTRFTFDPGIIFHAALVTGRYAHRVQLEPIRRVRSLRETGHGSGGREAAARHGGEQVSGAVRRTGGFCCTRATTLSMAMTSRRSLWRNRGSPFR